MTPDEIYRLVGQLIKDAPEFSGFGELSVEHHTWLGRVQAVVAQDGDLSNTATVAVCVRGMGTMAQENNFQQILTVLYKILAISELKVAPAMQGAFIPAGNGFSSFEAISRVLRDAKNDALVVDPYLDEKVLTDYASTLPELCALRLLAEAKKFKASLPPAVVRWQDQYGATRPLEARALHPPLALHDRLLIIDATSVYVLTQSLNAFATKAPASIVRADPETAALKIAAYQDLWNAGSTI